MLLPFEYEPSDHKSVQGRSKDTLIAFLDSELKSGTRLVQSALLFTKAGNSYHSDQAKGYAIRASEAVRRFVSKVQDTAAKADILKRLDELDRAIVGIATEC